MTDRRISRARFAAGTAAALASIALIREPARAAQWNYKYASNVSLDHPLNVRMRECWNAVRSETKGRLDVQIFPNNQLGGDTQALTQLRSGALQFFTLDGGILQSVVPVAAIQGVGFAFKDSGEAFRAMDGPLGDYVRDEIRKQGLYVHPKMWENGMRQITASTKPIRSAADLEGFKIRTPPGALWVDLFKSMGAAPGPLNFSEVYTALQTRVFDGQENPYAIIDTARLYEVQKYLSVTNHMWSAYHFLGNAEAWKALPPDVQARGRAQPDQVRAAAAARHPAPQRLALREAGPARPGDQPGRHQRLPDQAGELGLLRPVAREVRRRKPGACWKRRPGSWPRRRTGRNVNPRVSSRSRCSRSPPAFAPARACRSPTGTEANCETAPSSRRRSTRSSPRPTTPSARRPIPATRRCARRSSGSAARSPTGTRSRTARPEPPRRSARAATC